VNILVYFDRIGDTGKESRAEGFRYSNMPLDCTSEPAWKADFALEEAGIRLSSSKLKRLMDVVVAGLGLLFLSPFLLLVTLLIRLESPGPSLFRQRRTGLNGATFIIYKFRTMAVLEDGAVVNQATRHDCRATALGRFLRKTSIDELPNLINVVKGEMSLVGPRPHAVAHDRHWAPLAPGYDGRFMAKPGITGLAQVEGYRGEVRDAECMASRIAYDLQYIRDWSPTLDLKILLRTLMIGPFDPAAY
jgi:lipopolysaccharide/colanic/teichoic acid biosynthesis glycosyltransferase